VSLTGNVMTLTAIPWFVLQSTGSAARTGLIASLNFLPIVLANLFGGALVDRLGCKRTSVAADLMSGLTVAMIPLLYATVGLDFWVLAILVFLGALLDAPGSTARSALLPEVARDASWRLERASGVYAAIERGSRLAGAPLAGLLIVVVGAMEVLWIDAGTFFASALAIWLVVPQAGRPARRSRYLSELKEGLRFLLSEKVLAAVAVTVTATNLLDSFTTILLPVLAQDVYGSAVSLGLMMGAMGAGSVASALLFAATGHRLSRHKTFALGFVVVGLRYPLLALFPPQATAIGIMLVAGMASGPLNPIIDTVSYERVPPHMRGRVFGVMMSATWTAMPLGVLVAGVIVERVGLTATLMGAGAAYVAATITIWFNRALRQMDVQPPPAEVREQLHPG
jgi:MFS family permease